MNTNFSRTVRALITVILLATSSGVHAQTAPSSYTSAIRYDVLGRVTGTIAPDPDGGGPLNYAATRSTYDAAGRRIKLETGELATWQSAAVLPSSWATAFTMLSTLESSFDDYGRKTKDVVKGSDGVAKSVTQYAYDLGGRLLCTAVRMNPAVFASLPTSACTLGTSGSYGPDRITKNTYDTLDHVLVVQKAVGTSLQQDYATYTYSANGKTTSVKDAKGNLSTMDYDGFDRQVKWTFPSTTSPGYINASDYEQYGYDPNGNRTSLRKRDGSTITYQYDALNRNTVKIVPERAGLSATYTRDVYYGYDLRGLQTYARFDGGSGEGVTNSFDEFGNRSSSTLAMDGASRTLSYMYDNDGSRTQLTWMDGQQTSYAYDGLDRMSAVYEGGIGSTFNLVGFAYNQRGSVGSATGRYGQVAVYTPDATGRLGGLSHNFAGSSYDVTYGFQYNPAGQITSRSTSNSAYWLGVMAATRSYAANGLNQYASAGSSTIAYDANGNLTNDGSSGYVYDVENRLVSVSGATNAALRYDPLGRLYEVTASASGTTRFLHDGDELVAEFSGSGALLRRYVHGSRVDDPVVWYEGAGTGPARWLHANWQGSVVAVTDASGGAIALNKYDAYGIPAASNVGRFQYTGQAWMPELQAYYYKARIYSPTLGRFLQTDTVGYRDDLNLYAYVGNDPANKTDPSGMYSCGLTLTLDQCQTFTKAQDKAKQQITSAVGALKGIQSKIDSGAKLTKSEQKLADGVSKVFGKGAGMDSKALGSLINTGTKMLVQLNGNMPANYGGDTGDSGALARAPGNQLLLYSGFFQLSATSQAQIVAHESHHHSVGGMDIRLKYGNEIVSPYGYASAVRRAEILNDWARSLVVPDPTTFALGFDRDDD